MKRRNNKSSPLKKPPLHPEKPKIGGVLKEGIASGMSFGVGSAVAHRAIDAITEQKESNPDNTCQILMENYSKCLEKNYTVNQCDEIANLMKRFNCSIQE